VIQFGLISLDLLGLVLIGGIVAIATSAVQGTQAPAVVTSAMELFNLEALTPQRSAALLGLVAATLLILKSLLSYFFGLKNYAFLAKREAAISESLARKIFALQITELQKYTTPQYQHLLTNGSAAVMGGVLGQSLSLITEFALQISLLITLLFFSPVLTLVCLVFFLLLFIILNRVQGEKAKTWGMQMTNADVLSTSLIADAIGGYRENIVSGRRNFYVERIKLARQEAAKYQVNKSMLTQFSKYIFEISVVIAGLGISAFAFLTMPALKAASLVAIFFTAAYRIAPSVLKLQQGILQLKGAAGATELFFEIEKHLSEKTNVVTESTAVIVNYPEDTNEELAIELNSVSFSYPERDREALSCINLKIPAQKSFAIVGPSGAGKSTLVDLVLGVIRPKSGEVKVFGTSPLRLNKNENMRIGYVPQTVYLTNGSILDNICLGVAPSDVNQQEAWRVLSTVHLASWVSELEEGINSSVGERGSRLSGGQRQRLGIARALYLNPKLLVLDEATSSLDAESEYEISSTIHALKDKTTTIVIAHRLSTVMNADQVVYMQEGRIIAQGTFDSLRDAVPNFDRQANLMGIQR
jgi:ABC-type multidrug transport system fused ATPase/permease subunit